MAIESTVLRPIGRVETPYQDKFGVPRQPGLVPSARGRLVLEPDYRREEALRGLEQFSHVWLVFLFEEVAGEKECLTVRPPRLGGNEKVGVFATRSPFRPNRIGMSACRLLGIERAERDSPALLLSGVDLVTDTVVVDVKPYLPYADCVADAQSLLAPDAPARLSVRIAEEVEECWGELDEVEKKVICETLSLDARPAFHEEDNRNYYLKIFSYDVVWQVRSGECVVRELRKLREARNSD